MQEEVQRSKSQDSVKVEENDQVYRLRRFYEILLRADRSRLTLQKYPGENQETDRIGDDCGRRNSDE